MKRTAANLEWPRIRLVPALLWLGWLMSGTLIAVFTALPSQPDVRNVYMLSYLAHTLALWASIPLVQFASANGHNIALRRPRFWRWFPRVMLLNGACFSLFFLLKLTLARALRAGSAALLDVPGATPIGFVEELLYELPKDMAHFTWLFAAFLAFRFYTRERQEAERAARLEAMLVKSRLEALNARLDPHFIYNALNTLNSLMHSDLARTEQLFEDLGALLRAVLSEDRPVWSLAEERAHTRRYADLVEARFGERVRVKFSLPRELDRVALPRFCLLTLVENAVKHNQHERRPLRIDVYGERTPQGLSLAVSDDGVGFCVRGNGSVRAGGLDRLGETLRLLYGADATLTRESADPHGARVTLRLPEAS
ncbi:MAG: histidine kinase [Myxococcales bacterium]